MRPPGFVPVFEFHVGRRVRERYRLDDTLFASNGNVVLANFPAVRRLARRLNERRAQDVPPGRPVHPGELNAMGLIDEVLHYVAARYRTERDPDSLRLALQYAERELGRERLDGALAAFVAEFPPLAVHRGVEPRAWLAESTEGLSHRAVALEELLLLGLANANPAFEPFRELFDDRALTDREAYRAVLASLERWWAERPRFGPFEQTLVDMLRSPALAHPDSLSRQLEYIRRHWGYLLGDMLTRLLTGLDVLEEEEHARWLRFHPIRGDARGDSSAGAVPRFEGREAEPERFSHDRDWMPRVVLIAKSAIVWLDQLSRRYQREVRRLDQIPDEELDMLARWGVTGLWLIGLWERSRASRRIKQLMGNPEAAASAYSLLDYGIAEELGGDGALAELRARAWTRGIRLASDMVPNHMGIDSRWVIEHPDWFLSLPDPPYPGYTFNGPDVSSDGRVAIQIEDHYYDKSDAAVVFRRIDRASGETRFVYHGNDGTSYPWNDTAQLDYLKPHVREGVIQTILHVARQFPIIRFDAAMTLAKRHFQRLWYPRPGTGGGIPSRAEHGMEQAAFDAAFPQEFWREVVDRVAAEAPDTLLLAEAFWLMEGYFVRTLGMHRVYNSAFMNMLRDEENANYRSVIKNTLEFDPEILKRHVNFMSNPDERTAVDQFGKGDKYFGVCTLMATLPGLPMFGHGQVEGFEERYGMEYRRAYREEWTDAGLVERHEREIFPLLHRRAQFAEVGEFLLYDCFSPEGHVNEDVFAYSNRHDGQTSLVVYHNRYAHAAGWLRTSVGYAVKQGDGRALRQRDLGEGLGLSGRDGAFCRFRDQVTNLAYLRPSRALREQGLYLELGAYQRHVFLDVREVVDAVEAPWAVLERELAGRGVADLDEALAELRCRPLTEPLRELLAPDRLRQLAESARREPPAGQSSTVAPRDAAEGDTVAAAIAATKPAFAAWLSAARRLGLGAGEPAARAAAAIGRVAAAYEGAQRLDRPRADDTASPIDWAQPRAWGIALAVAALRGGLETDSAPEPARLTELARGWRVDRTLAQAFEAIGLGGQDAWRAAELAIALAAHAAALDAAASRGAPPAEVFAGWFADESVRRLAGVNEHQGVQWFRKEPFDEWRTWIVPFANPTASAGGEPKSVAGAPRPIDDPTVRRKWLEAMELAVTEAGWRVDRLLTVPRPRAVVSSERSMRHTGTTGTS